jgi:hypothetical protein
MIDFIGKGIVIDTIKTVLIEFSKKGINMFTSSKEERVNLSKAIAAIKLASIETKCYIEKEGYHSNSELSGFWLNAMNACIEAGITGKLPEFLYRKADFWGSPKEWLNNPSSLELVPKLKALNDECDSLLVKLIK